MSLTGTVTISNRSSITDLLRDEVWRDPTDPSHHPHSGIPEPTTRRSPETLAPNTRAGRHSGHISRTMATSPAGTEPSSERFARGATRRDGSAYGIWVPLPSLLVPSPLTGPAGPAHDDADPAPCVAPGSDRLGQDMPTRSGPRASMPPRWC